MITDDKITEIFYATDELCKKSDEEIENMPLLSSEGKACRRRAARMSNSEIMAILIMSHFGAFDNLKHYYLHFIRIHLKRDFPDAVSYKYFVKLESRAFFKMLFFLNLHSIGRCIGITFVDSTMIPVCRNLRRYANKVFASLATAGKGTMEWCHGFKLHFICNDRGEIVMFCLTGANVGDKAPKVWSVLGMRIYWRLFADRIHLPNLFDAFFADGVHLVNGIRSNMKNKLMPLWDKIMHRKRYVIECINHLLKDKGNLVHSRHRPVNHFLINLIAHLEHIASLTTNPWRFKGIVLRVLYSSHCSNLIPNRRRIGLKADDHIARHTYTPVIKNWHS